MDISCFTDKTIIPNDEELKNFIRKTFKFWEEIRLYTLNKKSKTIEEWNYPGVKYGWSFRIKDSKRAIIYFLPRNNYFKVAFVFGFKAFEEINKSNISEDIKNELKLAKVYAEGRGIRIDVKDNTNLNDIFKLIDIKINN